MRLTLKSVNEELLKRGLSVRLAKAPAYFYFLSGEAADWLETTVPVPTINSLTPQEWMAEIDRLKKLNDEITAKGGRKQSKGSR